jgi:hypothetical protein
MRSVSGSKDRKFYILREIRTFAPLKLTEDQMKTRFFLPFLMIVMLLSGCNSGSEELPAGVVNNPNTASGKTDQTILPAFEFDKEVHDFGKIIEGETVACTFDFTNVGKTDLLIADVNTSCGCTVPSYSRTPVRPGGKGSIRITFDTKGRHGNQVKSIVVVANTQPNTTLLRIKAKVMAVGKE